MFAGGEMEEVAEPTWSRITGRGRRDNAVWHIRTHRVRYKKERVLTLNHNI